MKIKKMHLSVKTGEKEKSLFVCFYFNLKQIFIVNKFCVLYMMCFTSIDIVFNVSIDLLEEKYASESLKWNYMDKFELQIAFNIFNGFISFQTIFKYDQYPLNSKRLLNLLQKLHIIIFLLTCMRHHSNCFPPSAP